MLDNEVNESKKCGKKRSCNYVNESRNMS